MLFCRQKEKSCPIWLWASSASCLVSCSLSWSSCAALCWQPSGSGAHASRARLVLWGCSSSWLLPSSCVGHPTTASGWPRSFTVRARGSKWAWHWPRPWPTSTAVSIQYYISAWASNKAGCTGSEVLKSTTLQFVPILQLAPPVFRSLKVLTYYNYNGRWFYYLLFFYVLSFYTALFVCRQLKFQ